MNEADFLALLRPLGTHPAARGFADDAAVLGDLVFTHDMLVEGVHYLPDDPPGDVAWKLLAVNLSDLAAKGAAPIGVLMGYMLSGDVAWDKAFVAGLSVALEHFETPLLGGDTVSNPAAPRVLSLTAIGRSSVAPSRSGAQAGDALYVTGTIGMAGLGLAELRRSSAATGKNVDRYRRPTPRLSEGQALAPIVHAMMDVSDGLLIDAQRMAAASNLALEIGIDTVPFVGERMAALTAGDDYELLFAAAPDVALPVNASRIGTFASGTGASGTGLTLRDASGPVQLPNVLGWLHQSLAQ